MLTFPLLAEKLPLPHSYMVSGFELSYCFVADEAFPPKTWMMRRFPGKESTVLTRGQNGILLPSSASTLRLDLGLTEQFFSVNEQKGRWLRWSSPQSSFHDFTLHLKALKDFLDWIPLRA